MNNEMLQKLGEQFGVALDWSKSNAIPYLQDLATRVLQYEKITSICWLIMFIISMGILCFFFCRVEKMLENSYCCDIFGLRLVIAAIIFFLVLAAGVQINDLILCTTLPEKIILRYLQSGGR